ncbi:ABC transporter substrate-binding protein [Microbacterium sp. PMB16]|uniref:ABC transporter substrate-binding protein n=1 Tax=Microbacterium sp. PMB16 TaxID=3120157 RepID=UPI003F4B1005
MSPSIKKSLLGISAIAASATLLLSGCSGSTDDAGGGDDTVVVSAWASSEEETAALESQIAVAQEQNPDLTIELRTSPWADYFTKMTTDLASGNMACVAAMNSSMLTGYTDGFRALSDADLKTAGIDRDDYADGAMDILSANDSLFGIPWDIATMVIFTNQDLLDTAGVSPQPGWTFDEFRDAAKATTTDGKDGFAVGISPSTWQAIPMSISRTQPVNEDGELDLVNPDFAEAANAFADLVLKDKVAQPVASAADANWARDQYSNGNAAMVIDGSWNAGAYLANEAGFAAGIATLPAADGAEPLSMILGSGYGLSQSCENTDAALRVLGSLSSPEVQDEIAESGRGYPARIDSQPLYFESLPEEHRETVRAAFEAAFENVEGQRVTSEWSKIGAYTQPNLVSVYTGQMSMDEMLENAQSQFGR